MQPKSTVTLCVWLLGGLFIMLLLLPVLLLELLLEALWGERQALQVSPLVAVPEDELPTTPATLPDPTPTEIIAG